MSIQTLVREAEKLSPQERWELIDELIRIAEGEEVDVALTPTQSADLRRRKQGIESNEPLIPGDQAVIRLRQRP